MTSDSLPPHTPSSSNDYLDLGDTGHGYIGRFAPSPTGELHRGSLLTAVASYLDARQQQGQWLVRMEDLDPPREQPGAADSILRSLEAHQLYWDGEVMLQSQRLEAYQQALEQLEQQGLTYPCNCTRQRLKSLPQTPAYDGHCRRHPPHKPPYAIRVEVPDGQAGLMSFEDGFQGWQEEQLSDSVGDFVILRKDGLFAYQLAVVVDDIAQGITHILRGSDLLDSSGRQLYLFKQLGQTPPQMAHLPVIVNSDGQKLSKQTFAEPLDSRHAPDNLFLALQQLGQNPPAELRGDCAELLEWSIPRWDRNQVPKGMAIQQEASNPQQPLS
ncbi:tRNA glutamyl-Q(34) synthetase GluQRS [Pseudomaricurvus sp.]|uniref:tRNA glutamyl-Q(34) synthetase GluQRS n=1 Tax=Pseudomaricurvus sp. TaxID=2004510 RepID=UPI003F6BDB24